MRTLVNQPAAARQIGVGAPFVLVADATTVPVTAPDQHEFAERAKGDQFLRLVKGAVVAVIEADMHLNANAVSRRENRLKFGSVARRRLFHEHVLAAARVISASML